MMINRRLIGTVPESKKYIAANITMMVAITRLLGSLAKKEIGEKSFFLWAVIIIAAVCIRYGCTIMASRMGYLASRSVKKLREMIYKKLLRLGNSYKEKVQTLEIVQVAVEGEDQLETYFGA